MVAVSLFFSALISLLLLSPIKDWAVAHAKSHGEWLLEARRFYRRSEHLSYGERDYSCDECRENEAGNGSSLRDLEEEFINRSRSVKFAGPLLIHIGAGDGDTILYSINGTDYLRTCVQTPLYRELKTISYHLSSWTRENFLLFQLKILSHLPVEVALIALENGTNRTEAIQKLLRQINISQNFPDKNILMVHNQLLDQINKTIASMDDNIAMFTSKLGDFRDLLRSTSQFAVQDYLCSLNEAIENLNKSLVSSNFGDTTIIIYHRQFAYYGSFIEQYYRIHSNSSARIILQPVMSREEYCSSSERCSVLKMTALSKGHTVSLERYLSKEFFGANNWNMSVHKYLDDAAKKIICSLLKDLVLLDCPTKPLPMPLVGFQTRIEKAYVVLFVFFGACTVVLGIFLLSICYEDRVTKAERKEASCGNRERPLSAISMQSDDEG